MSTRDSPSLQRKQFDKSSLEKEVAYLKESNSNFLHELELTRSSLLHQTQASFSPRVDWPAVAQQLRAELEQLGSQKAELEARHQSLAEAKKELEISIGEMKGRYEEEIIGLKLQVKTLSNKHSKSKFNSTTNMNLKEPEKPTPPKPQLEPLASKQPDNKSEKGSYSKKGWSDIKNVIHAKDEQLQLRRMNSGAQSVHSSQEAPKNKKSSKSSSQSNVENDLAESESSSDRSLRPISGGGHIAKNVKLSQPFMPRSVSSLPRPSTAKKEVAGSKHQEDYFKQKYELLVLKSESVKEDFKIEKNSLEAQLGKLKKETSTLRNEIENRKKAHNEKDAARAQQVDSLKNSLVEKEKQIIIALGDAQEAKSQLLDKDNQLLALKLELDKLKAAVEEKGKAAAQLAGKEEKKPPSKLAADGQSQLESVASKLRESKQELEAKEEVGAAQAGTGRLQETAREAHARLQRPAEQTQARVGGAGRGAQAAAKRERAAQRERHRPDRAEGQTQRAAGQAPGQRLAGADHAHLRLEGRLEDARRQPQRPREEAELLLVDEEER